MPEDDYQDGQRRHQGFKALLQRGEYYEANLLLHTVAACLE